MYRYEIMTRIAGRGAIAIIRTGPSERAADLARMVIDAGLDIVEIALTTSAALEAIRSLTREAPDALVGAGSVLDGITARLAIEAGARFLVSPATRPDVIEVGHRYGAAVIPGAQTPTELERAMSRGADAIKIFPASELGIGWLRAVRPVYPDAPLVPTGGIGPENAAGWLEAGAVAVGVGSSLTDGGEPAIEGRVRQVLDAVRAVPDHSSHP